MVRFIASYKTKHPSFYFDLNGNLLGTVTIRVAVTVDKKGDTFSGSSSIDAFDNFGNLIFQGTNTIKGTRITAD